MSDHYSGVSGPPGSADVEALLDSLDLIGAEVAGARWTGPLTNFQVRLGDGRRLTFEDCLQVGYTRPPADPEPVAITAWWADEPSPLLQSLAPEIRFSYHHLVFELGEGLLRVACRRLLLTEQ